MELEELKSTWKTIGQTDKKLSEQEIKKVVHHSSLSPLAKIRKNMMAELVGILIVVAGFYVFVFLQKEPSKLILIGLGVLTMISLLLFWLVFPRFYNHTKRQEHSRSISYSLAENISQLKNDLNLYTKTMLFLYIPACFAGFALSNYIHISVVIAFVLFTPIYYFLLKKWTSFFYGKYVVELEEMVNELEDE